MAHFSIWDVCMSEIFLILRQRWTSVSYEHISSLLLLFFLLLIIIRDTSGSAIHTEKQVHVDASIFELYIDLMCQFKPHHVENFIKTNEGYRLEETLAVNLFLFSLLSLHNDS